MTYVVFRPVSIGWRGIWYTSSHKSDISYIDTLLNDIKIFGANFITVTLTVVSAVP